MNEKKLLMLAILTTATLVLAVISSGLLVAHAINTQTEKCMLGEDR